MANLRLKKSYKKCATCVYWTGPREVKNSSFSGEVIVDNSSKKYECVFRGPGRGKRNVSYQDTCDEHTLKIK